MEQRQQDRAQEEALEDHNLSVRGDVLSQGHGDGFRGSGESSRGTPGPAGVRNASQQREGMYHRGVEQGEGGSRGNTEEQRGLL